MKSPFHSIRDFPLERLPWAHDLIFVTGKMTRGFYILLIAALFIAMRDVWVRSMRRDLEGQAFTRNQAYSFAGLVLALHAPFSLAPQVSWLLVTGVAIAILIFFSSLFVIRILCAPAHRRMIQGDMEAAQTLGWSTAGAAIAAHAVVGAVLNNG